MSALLTGGAGIAAVVLVRQSRRRPASLRAAAAGPAPRRSPRTRGPVPMAGAVARAGGRFVRQTAGPYRARRASARDRVAAERELPALAELFRTALTSGLSPTQAVRILTPLAPPASAALLRRIGRGLDLGLGLDGALEPLRLAGPHMATLARALVLSAELGAEAESALERIGEDARARLRQEAETRSRTVPVRLLFPLVLCVLPAFALLGVAPALLSGLSP